MVPPNFLISWGKKKKKKKTKTKTKEKKFLDSLVHLIFFLNLCNKDKFIWLMSNECDNVIEIFASYIYSCFQLRKASGSTETV